MVKVKSLQLTTEPKSQTSVCASMTLTSAGCLVCISFEQGNHCKCWIQLWLSRGISWIPPRSINNKEVNTKSLKIHAKRAPRDWQHSSYDTNINNSKLSISSYSALSKGAKSKLNKLFVVSPVERFLKKCLNFIHAVRIEILCNSLEPTNY